MYPGWGSWVAGWEGVLPGYYPAPSKDPYLVIFSLKGPTHGPMKLILEVSMRFPRIDLRIDLELTSESTQNDPPETTPRLVPR